MDLPTLMASMDSFPAALASAIAGLSDNEARWKPPSGAWSILEIVCHLADEEAEDFRQRVFSTLDDPDKPWPGIDPEAAATDRTYNERILAELEKQGLNAGSPSNQLHTASGNKPVTQSSQTGPTADKSSAEPVNEQQDTRHEQP